MNLDIKKRTQNIITYIWEADILDDNGNVTGKMTARMGNYHENGHFTMTGEATDDDGDKERQELFEHFKEEFKDYVKELPTLTEEAINE